MLLCLWGCTQSTSTASIAVRNDAADARAWLASRVSPAEVRPPRFDFAAEFYRNRLFLLGEVHGIAVGQTVDLALLQHLHARAAVRQYIGEFDFAQAAAFQHFLDTGDAAPMDAVFAGWARRGLQWANADYRAKLVAMRAWNASLPAQLRVHVRGADEVQDRDAAARWLARLLANAPPGDTPEAAALANAVPAPGNVDDAAWQRLMAAAHAARMRLPATELGEQLSVALASLSVEHLHASREARIAANVMSILEAAPPDTGAYGLWGLFHVLRADVSGATPMARILEGSGGALAGRVGSVMLLYLDARMLVPVAPASADGLPGQAEIAYTMDDANAALVHGIEDIEAVATGALTLAPLAGVGSPYVGSTLLGRVGGRFGAQQPFEVDVQSANGRPFVDYVLLSRGSPATQAWVP